MSRSVLVVSNLTARSLSGEGKEVGVELHAGGGSLPGPGDGPIIF